MAGGTLLIRVMPEKGVFGPALASEVEGASATVEKQSGGIGAVAGNAVKVGLVGAVAGIGAGLVTAMNLEQAEVAFTRFLGSGEKAQAFIGDLKGFAAKTPFELPGLIDQARNLMGVGVAAADVIPLLRDFGDATAAMGLSQAAFDNIMLQVRQGIGAGRFQLEELNAIADNGLPIFQLLAEALGKPVAEIRAMASAGQLLAGDVLPVLREQMQADYGGSLEAQSQTLAGLFSSLKDSIGLALADGVQPLVPFLKDALPDAAETSGEAIAGVSTALGLVFQVAGPLLSTGLELLGLFADLPGPVQAIAVAMLAWRLGGSQVTDMLSGLRDRVRTVREEMALQAALLAAQQRDVGLAGAAYGDLSTRMTATTAASDALSASGGRVRSGLAALGGTDGVIGGVAGGLSQVAERYAAASAAGDGFTGRLGALTAAAGTATRVGIGGLVGALGGPWGLAIGAAVAGIGALVSANAEAAAAEAAHKAKVDSLTDALRESNGEITDNIRLSRVKEAQDKGVFKVAKQAGVSIQDVTAAINGQGDKLDEVTAKLRAYAQDGYTEVVDANGQVTATMTEQGQAAADAADQIEGMAGDVDVARAALDEQNEALGENAEATGQATAQVNPLAEAMGRYAAETATAEEKSSALIDALNILSGGSISLRQAEAGLQAALDGLSTSLGENGRAAAEAALAGDLTSESARKVQDDVLGARDAMITQAQAAYDAAAANGDTAAGADAAAAAAQRARDEFIKTATQSGINAELATQLADAYGLVPGNVITEITQPGMDGAQAAAAILRDKILEVPDSKTVTTSALTDVAVARLQALGFTVTNLPGGRVQVTAATGDAEAALSTLARTRYARVVANLEVGSAARAASVQSLARQLGLAEGGRLEYFAAGGLRAFGRTLTPMRANWAAEVPADTWRVVGDRARGREWFIPEHAPNSLPLLADAAAAHGLQLVKAMADGGLLGGRPAAAPAATAAGERAPLIGSVSFPLQASTRPREVVDELLHEVRVLARGGVYPGGRP